MKLRNKEVSHEVGITQRKGTAQELRKWDWSEKMGKDIREIELGSKPAFKVSVIFSSCWTP